MRLANGNIVGTRDSQRTELNPNEVIYIPANLIKPSRNLTIPSFTALGNQVDTSIENVNIPANDLLVVCMDNMKV